MNSESVKENIMSEEEIEELSKLIRERMKIQNSLISLSLSKRIGEYKYLLKKLKKNPTDYIEINKINKIKPELNRDRKKEYLLTRKNLNSDNEFNQQILPKLETIKIQIQNLKTELSGKKNLESNLNSELKELKNPRSTTQKLLSFVTRKSNDDKEIQINEYDKKKGELEKGINQIIIEKEKLENKIEKLEEIQEDINFLIPIYQIPFEELDKTVVGGKRKSRVNKRKSRRNKRKSRRNKRKTSRR
jgi:hypothetical protein